MASLRTRNMKVNMLRCLYLVAIRECWARVHTNAHTWQFRPVIGCGRSELYLKGKDCVGSGPRKHILPDWRPQNSMPCEAEAKPWDTTPGRRILGRSTTDPLRATLCNVTLGSLLRETLCTS
ncbi:hypothetical protein EI94DRAFT_74182 [Lactarius quietus]|nr:hypothetical protein EI94DRAFT_74182 [Lactarius quietus]